MSRRQRQARQRGSALITTLWITIALTGAVLVLCKEMKIEVLASANRLSQAKADAAELGVEQYILCLLDLESQQPGYLRQLDQTQGSWQGRPLGDCYFWVLRPNPADEQQPDYGLTDEAGKLDLNTATTDMLQYLPNIDLLTVANIAGWRSAIGSNDANFSTTNSGASDMDYLQQGGYHLKSAPFETTDEIMLLQGMTQDFMHGADRDWNGWIDNVETQNQMGVQFQSATTSARGLFPYITAYGVIATNPSAAAVASGAATTVTDPNTGNSVTVADVNSTSTTNLQNILNQYLPAKATTVLQATSRLRGGTGGAGGRGGGGGGTTGTPFTNVWDWANKVQLTGDDFIAVYPFVVCNPVSTGGIGGTTTTTTKTAKVNIMTASKQVLMCLQGTTSGLTEADADAIIAYRESTILADPTDIGWLLDQVGDRTVLPQIGSYITGKSTCYSADIVAVSGDGRAFKRVRIVVDGSVSPPQIFYRRDLSGLPFPLPAEVRASLRAGQGPNLGAGDNVAANHGLTLGIR